MTTASGDGTCVHPTSAFHFAAARRSNSAFSTSYRCVSDSMVSRTRVRSARNAGSSSCDEVFLERQGWFSEFYAESRHWPDVPATFKSWPEYEDKAASLRVWSPSIIHGLLQTEAYARALISVQPAITQETISARLASRMERRGRGVDSVRHVAEVVDRNPSGMSSVGSA
jgi:hypothetical protein